jgi:hypothetical protein
MDLRPPHHLIPRTWIVLEGPAGAGKTALLDGIWRAAHGLGTGPRPLFDRAPVFTEAPHPVEWQSTHLRRVVEPALMTGRSVFMERCWWSDVVHDRSCTVRAADSRMSAAVSPGRLPDLILVMNAQLDGHTSDRYAALVEMYSERTVALTGRVNDITKELFAILVQRSLYFAKPPVPGDRP